MAEIAVYNAAGEARDLEWLRSRYGPFVIYDPPPLGDGETALTWRITALREKINAPASLIIRTRGLDGELNPGIKVAWYWPDADENPGCGPQGGPFEGVTPGRAVFGYTNAAADMGFAMGNGAYSWPDRGERGPHAAWIYGAETRSQLILGLGMIAATNHFHFDVEYTQFKETGGEDPGPGPGPGEEEFLELMDRITCALERIADHVETRDDL